MLGVVIFWPIIIILKHRGTSTKCKGTRKFGSYILNDQARLENIACCTKEFIFNIRFIKSKFHLYSQKLST